VITPNASLYSSRLEVCLFKHGGRLNMIGQALRLGLNLPLRPPMVEFFSSNTVEIMGARVAVQVDGDAWGALPVRIESQPDALSIVLPRSTRCQDSGKASREPKA
jgi:diacylglycerol kinase family enzyme